MNTAIMPTMMIKIEDLVAVADAYREAVGGATETTVSHRVFGDTKRLSALRDGREITVGRFNHAMRWFAENWPKEAEMPKTLSPYLGRDATPQPQGNAA